MLKIIWKVKKLEELRKNVIRLFKEEHQDWVKHLEEAEKNNTGVDLNLGGNFAERVQSLNEAFEEFRARSKKKKGLF